MDQTMQDKIDNLLRQACNRVDAGAWASPTGSVSPFWMVSFFVDAPQYGENARQEVTARVMSEAGAVTAALRAGMEISELPVWARNRLNGIGRNADDYHAWEELVDNLKGSEVSA